MTSSVTRAPSRVTPRSFYRFVAIAEAVTWTLLIAGMLLKYAANLGDLPVLIGGSIHGLVFITYALTAVLVGVNQRWSIGQIVIAVATAIVPYATIPYDIWLDRRGRLDGDWHRDATDDPRDQTWVRRLLRWFLNHTAVLVTLFVLAVIVIMTVLLILGPPGGWN
jgi:integral membrane protein